MERAGGFGEDGIQPLASQPEHNVLARLIRLSAAKQLSAGRVPDFPSAFGEQRVLLDSRDVLGRRVWREQLLQIKLPRRHKVETLVLRQPLRVSVGFEGEQARVAVGTAGLRVLPPRRRR